MSSLPIMHPVLFLLFILFLIISPSKSASPTPTPRRYPPCPVRLSPEPPVNNPAPAIVGGQPSSKLTASYLVALYSRGVLKCTGTLLSPLWLLTAAHCELTPSISTARLLATDDSSGVLVRIARVFTAPQLNNTHPASHPNDVALVKLASPAPPAASFALLNPNPALPVPRAYARAVGYGDTAFATRNKSVVLRQVDVPVIDWDQCKPIYPERLTLDRLCAGYIQGGCDACQGDSGGPLLQFDLQSRPVIVGIVNSGYLCAEPHFPSMYMRVSSYIQWMRTVGAKFSVAGFVPQLIDLTLPEYFPPPSPSPTPSIPASVVPFPRPSFRPPTVQCPVVLPQPPSMKMAVRVVGGEVASEATVAIAAVILKEFAVHCSGVLISPKWILTLGACNVTTSDIILVGGLVLDGGKLAAIDEIFVQSAAGSADDESGTAALTAIRLRAAVPSSQFASLNSASSLPATDSFARLAGYGTLGKNESPEGVLRQVDVPVVSNEQCRVVHPQLTAQMLCTGYEDRGCGPCNGDGGAPLFQYDEQERPVVVGIVASQKGCSEANRPALYVRTSSAISWLETIGADFSSTDQITQAVSDVSPSSEPFPSEEALTESAAPSI